MFANTVIITHADFDTHYWFNSFFVFALYVYHCCHQLAVCLMSLETNLNALWGDYNQFQIYTKKALKVRFYYHINFNGHILLLWCPVLIKHTERLERIY